MELSINENNTYFNKWYLKGKNNNNVYEKLLFGMIHVRALPGTPLNNLSNEEILKIALNEAKIYSDYNFDGIIIENMFDIPYLKREVGPEIVSMMTVICKEIKNQYFKHKPVGVQILAGCNKASLAVAYASGCDFIRSEGFVFGHIADEGFIDADCGELLRYRKLIGAEKCVKIITDIKKKHSSHSITEDLNIVDMSLNAEYFLSDGIIVTGESTGKEANLNDVKNIKSSLKNIPVFVGSGIEPNNLKDYSDSDAFIVGSYLKKNGYWANEIDINRVKELIYSWKAFKDT